MVSSIDAGKLVVAAISLSVDPSGTAAAAFGLDVVGNIKSWFSKSDDLQSLSTELGQKYAAKLSDKRFDKPDDARQLLPQMLESARPEAGDFTDKDLNAEKIVNAMLAKLSENPDYRPIAIQNAFRDLVFPLLRQACNDPRLLKALGPYLQQEVLARLGNLSEKLQHIETLPRDQLEL